MAKEGKVSTVAVVAILITTCLAAGPIGCPSQEKAEAIALLETALTDLSENRSLAEQYVRDVKAKYDPSDPAYQQAEESYDNARDAYNRFLDSVESGQGLSKSRTLRSSERVLGARDATAEFFSDATSALRPGVSLRSVPFRRAVVIPDNLERILAQIPERDREVLVDRVDRQVRWRSWSGL